MKKITLLIAFLMAFVSGSYAQCINDEDDQYPGDVIVSENLGFVQEIATCNYTLEYAHLSNILIGEDYVFTCNHEETDADKYITVTDLDNNVIAFGDSPLTVENITANEIRVHFTENAECDTQDDCHITTIQILLQCPVPLELEVSGVTTTSATFGWEPGGEETAWEVLVLEADLDAPTSTTSGTPVTVTPSYTTTILEPANEYFFYVRANCGSDFSPWNRLKFASGCNPINLFNENFNTTDPEVLPTCWSAIIENAEDAYIETVEYNGTDDSNSVQINFSNSGSEANVILVSPALGNLAAATHRLKFTSFSYDPATLEFGTLDGATAGSAFTIVGEELDVQTGNHEYVVDFTTYSGTDTFVGIRMTSGYSVFLDNIRWELAPLCPDVTEIAVTAATINTASFSWNPGGDETEWDLVFGAATVTDPSTLTPITPNPTGVPEGNISGLTPSTTYNVWVRSVCGVNDGAWIGPVTFTTPCLPTALFNENFDTTEYGDLPACWSSIIRGTQVTTYDRVYTYDANGYSDPNSVRLQRDYPSTETFLVSPNLSTLPLGTHRLKFYSFGYDSGLEIGTLTSSSDQAEFTMLQEVEVTDEYAEYTVDFTVYEGTDTFIGIRLSEGYSIYLDDIRWEIAPLCADVTDIEVTALTTATASFVWTPGGDETSWDIVYGADTVTDPNTLTPIAPAPTGTSEATISGLTPGTNYKAWIRSKCGVPNGDGAWIGPIAFTTSCLPTALFDENFDSADLETLPTCWSSIVRGEDTPNNTTVYTVDYNYYSGPNSVRLGIYNENENADTDVILVSPNLSTLTTGTHRLKFFGRGYMTGSLQIGTLDSASSTAVFTSWEEVVITEDYTEYVVDFTGYEGTDTFVGIRHNTGDYTFLDNIRWELAPLCADVQDINISEITTQAATVTWEPGGSETNWQVAYGPADVTDPSTLTPSELLTQSTFPIGGLTQNTGYNVWVRSACGSPNGNGAWIGPINFYTLCLPTTVPYTENFESADTPNLPNCSSSINLSDGNEWGTNEIEDYGFDSNVLQYLYNYENAANAWFFTQGINLTAGTAYTISYKYGSNSEEYEENLKVMYGVSPDADNMTNEIAVYEAFSFNEAVTDEINFTPETTGVYHFGFNVYSMANQYNVYIDDIAIDLALDNGDFSTSDFKFYPNPVKDVLHLSYAQNITHVAVYNLLGQIVLDNTINATTTQVDMSGLASGSYLVKVTADNQTKTIKVIKQ